MHGGLMNFQETSVDNYNAKVLVAWGDTLAKTGHTEKTIKKYEEAIKLDPINVQGLLELGKIFKILKESAKAEHAYKTALARDPEGRPGKLAQSALEGM